VPSIRRTSYRKWAIKSEIPLSSLWRLCKRVGARKHKRWVEPVLSDKQKRERVGFALSHMHRKGRARVVGTTWESTCTQKRTPPNRQRAQNKRFITKVMFLAAVARPRMIFDGVWFDGKIGIWPIADTVAAMRSSKNRKKGPMMLKPATITAESNTELIIYKDIHAIKAIMPRPPGHTIFVPLVGAKP
ncbi:unnamed protein product, partial [Discosporangium mesarthrocarpum]